MTNFVLIAICMIAGMFFARSKTLPPKGHKGINAWIIYLGLPAISFKYLPHVNWSYDLLLPALTPVIIWLGSWLYCKIYAAHAGIHKGTEGGMKLTCGLSSISFVAFPLIVAYFSEAELAVAIICDQVIFILLSTAGALVAINSSGNQSPSAAFILKDIFRFPPFLSCIAALTLPHFIDLSAGDLLFDKLAATVTPLALFSVGLQLKLGDWRRELRHLSAALLYKLLIAPVLILIIVLALDLKGHVAQISIFTAAMPSMVMSGVIADTYNLNPKLSNLVIGVGIIASFATTALWYEIIHGLR